MHLVKGKLMLLVAAVLLVWSVPAAAQNATTVSGDGGFNMERAVIKALRDNPSIQSAKAGDLAAEESRKSALGGFGPSLTGSYGYLKSDHDKPRKDFIQYDENLFSLGLNLSQPLFKGFSVLSTYQKSVLEKDQAAAQVDNSELKLILLVQENFLKLLAARENQRSAADQLERLQSQLKVTQAFYDVGLNPRIDVLQAERDVSDAEDKLLQAENDVQTQIARLNTLLNLPLDASQPYLGSLDFVPFGLTLEECLDRAYRQRPDIVIAQKAIDVAREDRTLAQSSFYPQVDADVDFSRKGDDPMVDGSSNMSTEFSEWSVGVTASWNLFNSGQDYYKQSSAAQVVNKVVADEADLRQEVAFEVKSRHLKLSEAAKRIKVAQKTVEQAKEAYRMAVARYQAQVGTNTDVLDAQASLTSAEAALTSAQADYLVALASLYVSIGEKNPSLRMAAQ
ncbi:TolC family protein [Oleidesulfovibrio sp.]|uniref:TolC family protein n=1 Tax=Oleidesulfovibrio sp. TaxID=2909707 RepID=UPI003A88E637